MQALAWHGFVVRFAFATVMVFATFNPSGYSYYHWVAQSLPEYSVLMILVGVILLIGWTILLRASVRSLGPFGLLLAAAFFGVSLWLLVDLGWVEARSGTAITYLVLVALSGVLATGVSWSHIRRRVSGQADVDAVDPQ